jgi:hypothetical protein
MPVLFGNRFPKRTIRRDVCDARLTRQGGGSVVSQFDYSDLSRCGSIQNQLIRACSVANGFHRREAIKAHRGVNPGLRIHGTGWQIASNSSKGHGRAGRSSSISKSTSAGRVDLLMDSIAVCMAKRWSLIWEEAIPMSRVKPRFSRVRSPSHGTGAGTAH